jgi:hypothetical protein
MSSKGRAERGNLPVSSPATTGNQTRLTHITASIGSRRSLRDTLGESRWSIDVNRRSGVCAADAPNPQSRLPADLAALEALDATVRPNSTVGDCAGGEKSSGPLTQWGRRARSAIR